MAGTARCCALAGCGQPIDDVVGRPQRLYCSSAHRLAARQARRRAAQRERAAEPAQPAMVMSESGWAALNEAALAIRAAYAEQQWLAAAIAPTSDPVPERSDERELPEWARQAGLASDLSRSGFWPGWAARFMTTPGRRRAPEPSGRRRTMAVLGAAGIVAGGYALTPLQVAPGPDAPTPVQLPPTPTLEQRWATRAQVTMSSFDRQLEVIERAEREWRRLRPAEPLPAELTARKVVLNQRKAALADQLDTVRSLDRARAELARSEEALRATETDPAAPEPQRRQREQDRDERRREVAALAATAATAVRTPLPDDGERTTEIAERVREGIRSAVQPPVEPTVAAPPADLPEPGPDEPAPDGQSRPYPPVGNGIEPGPGRGSGPTTGPAPAPGPDGTESPSTGSEADRSDPSPPPAEKRGDAGRTGRQSDLDRSADGGPKAGAKRAHEAERRSRRSRSVGERAERSEGARSRSDSDRGRPGRSTEKERPSRAERSSRAADCDDHDEDRPGRSESDRSDSDRADSDRADSDKADRRQPESKRSRLARVHQKHPEKDHAHHRHRDEHHGDEHHGDEHHGDEHHDRDRDADRDRVRTRTGQPAGTPARSDDRPVPAHRSARHAASLPGSVAARR